MLGRRHRLLSRTMSIVSYIGLPKNIWDYVPQEGTCCPDLRTCGDARFG